MTSVMNAGLLQQGHAQFCVNGERICTPLLHICPGADQSRKNCCVRRPAAYVSAISGGFSIALRLRTVSTMMSSTVRTRGT